MKKLLSKVLAVIIAVMLVASTMPVAFAADGDIASGTAGEGVNWVLSADGTLTISGEGEIVVDWYAPPWENYINDIYVVDIKEGITTIPGTAFCYAENLITVNVPASVTNMDENSAHPFWACYALQEINVHADNATYVSVDGVVFSKDMTVLCYYPANKAGSTYTIPSSVTTLGTNSFNYTKNLNSLTLPDTVTTLEHRAFYNSEIKTIILNNNITTIPQSCFLGSSLENIVISDSVESIESSAFYDCNNLKNITFGTGLKTIARNAFCYCDGITFVHYLGTEAQWNEIAIDEENNEYILNATVHYVTDEMYQDGFDGDCATNGHTGGLYCAECEIHVTGSVIYAPGHNFENGVCTKCNEACEHQHYDFDGICEICGENTGLLSINIGETKSVYTKEEHGKNIIMFTATQSGVYVLNSDVGDNNADPYVTLYDSNGNEIGYSDDVDSGRDFELPFNAVAGESYYFELSSYNADSFYDITLDKYLDFLHQPSSEEPFVVFSWESAELQWYTATPTLEPVTLNNAQTISYDWGSSSYDSQNGWTGVRCNFEEDYSDYDFFTISLKAGESIAVTLYGDYSNGVGLWDYDRHEGVWCDLTDDNEYILTAERDGNYTFYTFSDTGDVTVKANYLKFDFTKIVGQTGAELKNPVIGTKYACIADIYGHTVMSDIFEYTYFITHQPTSTEPYVTLNEQSNEAKYQWYKLEEGVCEITDENATPFEMGSNPAYYDSEIGWSGYHSDQDGTLQFFYIDLNEGETITVKANGNVSEIYIYNPEISEYTQRATPDENGEVTLTSAYSTSYIVAATCDVDTTIRAYGNAIINTKVENQTTSTLTDANIGTTYFCEVSVGDRYVTSDIFEYAYAITKQPTKAEPFVELNNDIGATYQWHSVSTELVEITDQDNVLTETEETGVLATYDAETGWSGTQAGEEAIIYFATEFYEGQKITFKANDDAAAVAILDVFSELSGENIVEAAFDETGTATLTVPCSSTFIIMVNSTTDTTIKVYAEEYTFTPIENETEAALKTTDKGLFACEVTFGDGSTEISDILNTNYMFGDINDDNKINNKDLALLMQHINKWDVTVNIDAADVNVDGKINNKDLALLMQYINKWDVTLGQQ